MVAHNCHGKRNNLTAKGRTSRQKEKDSRQKKKPHGKKKKPHGKNNKLTAKVKDSRLAKTVVPKIIFLTLSTIFSNFSQFRLFLFVCLAKPLQPLAP